MSSGAGLAEETKLKAVGSKPGVTEQRGARLCCLQLPFSSSECLNEIMEAGDLVQRLAGCAAGVGLGSNEPRERGAVHKRVRPPLRVLVRELRCLHFRVHEGADRRSVQTGCAPAGSQESQPRLLCAESVA